MSEINFDGISTLLGKLDYTTLMEVVETHWCRNEIEYHWVDENGDVYSGEVWEGGEYISDFYITNLDTCQGYKITKVFKKEMEMDEDEFFKWYVY